MSAGQSKHGCGAWRQCGREGVDGGPSEIPSSQGLETWYSITFMDHYTHPLPTPGGEKPMWDVLDWFP